MSSSEQIAENMLTAMQIIAESQPNNNDITIDGFIIDASRAKEGMYIVGSGYSQFTAYASTIYKENDDVYILIPGGDYNNTKLIVGRRMTEGSGAYNVIDELEDMVFFHDSNSSLIEFSGKSLGIQANNSSIQETLIGTWEGSYAGVSKLGLAPTFTSYLKPLGIVNGNYGIRLLITDNTGAVEKVEFDSSEYFGSPYNYIYSTRLTRVYELATTKTITKIEAYLYQKNNFVNFNEEWVAPKDTDKNIFLMKFFIGVGAAKSEIMASRCMIATTSGSNTYYSPEYAETLKSNPAIEKRFNETIDWLLKEACENSFDEIAIENAWQSKSSNFSLAEFTRINNWLKNYKFFSQLAEAKTNSDRSSFCQQVKQDAVAGLLSQLTCYTPRISFSFAVKEDDKMKYYSSIPSFDTTAEGKKAKSEFIQWFRAKSDSVTNSNTLPPELLTGWELIGYMDIDGKTTDNFLSTGELVFVPDYTQNTETLKALITYKNKQYISNALVLNNLRNAEKEISQEEIKKALDEVTAQRYSDLDLISANQKALNDIYLDCGYYDGEDFISNHGQFNYYTRSGSMREEWVEKKFVIRCYSLNSERTTLPTMLASNKDFYCAQAGSRTSMIFSQQDAIYKSFNVNGTAVNGYELAFTPSHYYEPARTANTFIFSAKCHVDGNTSDILLENSLTLSFGYYDCLGTSHTVTAYWTSSKTGEKVHSLVPGKEYIPHIVIDGKEMPGNWQLKGTKTHSFTTYIPDLQDICVAYGVVEVGKVTQEDPDGLKLACYLPAIISYNEDNIIEGPTEIVYLSDGLPHLRMSEQADDVGPTYRLELLIEDNNDNQKYMTDVPWIDTITPQTTDKLTLAYGITADWLNGSENVTVSSPSNWSIQTASNKDPIAYMRGSKAQTSDVEIDNTKAQVFLENFGTLTACSVKYTNDKNPQKVTDYSKVELTPLSYFLSEMDGQVYGVRVYTAYGYLLATIPVICRISHYASAYIDNMSQYNGMVTIDKNNNIIYSPRILAGKYEDADAGAGQKVFTGVALGDYCNTNTDASMRLTGIYGFNKGTQVYAFTEDGKAFIGSNKGRINFDGTNATIKNSGYDDAKNGSGMLIDVNKADIFCHRGTNQAYFGASNEKNPLWINNTNNFSVDWDGNVTIGGKGSINIDNGDNNSKFRVNSNGINMTGMISLSKEGNKVDIDGEGINLSSGKQTDSTDISLPDQNNSVKINSNGISLSDGKNNKVNVNSNGINMTGKISLSSGENKVDIDSNGINLSDRKNIVNIGSNGINLSDGKNNKVNVSTSGINMTGKIYLSNGKNKVDIGSNGINLSDGKNNKVNVNTNGINMTGIISLSDGKNNKVNIDGTSINLSNGDNKVDINGEGINLSSSRQVDSTDISLPSWNNKVNINSNGINMTGLISLSNGENKVDIDGKGIILSNGENRVDVSSNGISLSSGGQTGVIIGSNGIQMTGSISFPSNINFQNGSISTNAVKDLDDKIGDQITNATNKIHSYTADQMLQDLQKASGENNGLFTWKNENGITMTGLNASCIKTGVIDASLIKTGKLDASLIKTGELDGRLIKAESLKADSIGAGTLRVTVGIKQGFDLIGDKSRGASTSDDPRKWQTFGHLTVETGEAQPDPQDENTKYTTYGVKIAVDQKDFNGHLTNQQNLLFISDAGIRIELGGGSDNGGVTFGFYNSGLQISGKVTNEEGKTEIKTKTYSWE